MGEFIYSFSAFGATVHKVDDMSVQVELDLPGHYFNDYTVLVESEDSGESEEEMHPCNTEDAEACED